MNFLSIYSLWMKNIWIAILFYASLKIYVLKITQSTWLPFRRKHSSNRDPKMSMTSRSFSRGIAATSSWIRCFRYWSTHLKVGYPCFYRLVWWNRSVTRYIEMSAKRAPSPHQTISILITSLKGESMLLTHSLLHCY